MEIKIVETKNGANPVLRYKYTITKFEVKRKNSDKINTFHSTVLPDEIIKFFDVQDRNIFFYEKNGTVYITSRRPAVEHQNIKIQQTKQFSIPKAYFNPEDFNEVKFNLNLGLFDEWRGQYGLLSMELI